MPIRKKAFTAALFWTTFLMITASAAGYETGFEWRKATDYTEGTIINSTVGNPNLDQLGNPAWSYETFIGPSGNFNNGSLMVWDGWRWVSGGRFVNVSIWDQNTHLNSNWNNTGITSLVRWINPTGGPISVDVTGRLRTYWGGQDSPPGFVASPVDVRVILGHYDVSAGSTELLIDRYISSPISQDTVCNTFDQCPHIDTTLDRTLSVDAGDSIFWTTIPQGYVPGKNRWITTNDEAVRITLTSVAEPANDGYVLLYSTYGYELKGSKRALARTYTDTPGFLIDIGRSGWQLVDEQDIEVMSGPLVGLGVTYGSELWEIDFSSLRVAGRYKLVVSLESDPDTGGAMLQSDYFDVTEGLYTNKSFRNIAIYNPEERQSSAYYGYGFYDCNSLMGEAYSHGVFLAGLVNGYVLRKDILTPDEEARLIEMIDVTVDYLLLLHNGTTGEFAHEYPTRPMQDINTGPYNSSDAVYGLATYIQHFATLYPVRAADIYNKILQTIDYLNTQGLYWPIEMKVIVYHYLYEYSGNTQYKDTAVSYLNSQLAGFDLSAKWRGGKATSYFEGLYHMVNSFPDHPDHANWVTRASEISQTYYHYVLQNNGYHVVPQGTGPSQWNDMASPPTGWTLEPNPTIFYANGAYASAALDALFLAMVTGDQALEGVAAGSLGWITGLHPGIPSAHVTGISPSAPISSAAFIINIDGRYVLPWSSWWWGPPTSNMQSIENGFIILNGKLTYQDRWESGETFIYTDGLFIYATALYEDYVAQTNMCLHNLPVMNVRTVREYSSLQVAYDDTETADGDTILSQFEVLNGDLNLDRPISVIITGGYNCNFTVIEGKTILKGDLTVSNGRVTIGDFILE